MSRAGRVLLALGSVVLSCRRADPPKPPPLPMQVEVSGCAAFRAAPNRCELDENRIVRVVVGPGAFAVSTEVGPLEPIARVPVGAAVRLTLALPPSARELRLTMPPDASGPSVRIDLSPSVSIPALDSARTLRASGKLEEATRVLGEFLGTATGEARARALSMLARIELAKGASDDAIRHLREAIPLHVTAARVSDVADDGFALSHALVQHRRRFDEARAALASSTAAYPDGRARRPFYLGELAFETGDLRSAARAFREARAEAIRLGMRKLQRIAEQSLALALQASGRASEASALLDAVLADSELSPCERADALTNRGWIALLVRETGGTAVAEKGPALGGSPIDPESPTREALALVRKHCSDPQDEANLLVNLALAAVQTKNAAAARVHLADAEALLAKSAAGAGTIALWALEIRGRAALASDDPREALLAFTREEQLAEASTARELAWRGAVGSGEALEVLGRNDAASAAYARAEAYLDALSLDVPHGDGRDAFLGDRERSARQQVDLLVRLGRAKEALEVARKARRRAIAATARSGVLSALPSADRAKWERAVGVVRAEREAIDREAASDWKLAADRLAPVLAARKLREAKLETTIDEALAVIGQSMREGTPRPLDEGEMLLAFHPIRRGFAVFAADATGVEAHTLERLDGSALADAILLPIRPRLLVAKRIRVLPYGLTHAIDVHALSFEGAPLVARAPVTYSLDVPSPETPKAGDSMLLVADPTGDLPAARAEAKTLAALHPQGLQSLLGEQATSVLVRAALPKVDRFHYAGHGSSAGEAGWESQLPLAGGALTVEDVLALPRVPAWVMLSACEGAKTNARAEGLGVAQAFVLAGSMGVVAATRDVADSTAHALARHLYGDVEPAGTTDAASLLRTGQLALRTSAPSADWAAFRVLTP